MKLISRFTLSKPLTGLLASAALIYGVQAEVKPNGLFGDGAVLQQKIKVPVWGTARDGEKVSVKFQGQEVVTVAKDGRWSVTLKPLKAGGPFAMTITGDNTITFTNVLVGEVWLCSGQSNMGFKLNRAENAADAIAAASDSQLRLYSVPHEAMDVPQTDVAGKWDESAPNTAANFSAVAYFFGKHLRETLRVPIGLIDSSVGGTPAEAWVSRDTLERDPELKKILELQAERVKNFDPAKAKAEHEAGLARYRQAVTKANAEDKTPPAAPLYIDDPTRSSKRPASLYNAMIAPLQPFAIAGAIWYQGESNAGRADQYKTLFPALIQSWRAQWGEFPFLFVQIAPYQGTRHEIRDAQLWTWQHVPRTAMVGTLDIGEAKNIHPVKKEPVGERLALAARAVAYGEQVEFSGPVFAGMKIKGNRVEIQFTHAQSGLMATGGALKGFTVAGADGKFVPAEAVIQGEHVVVSAAAVAKPVAVRYGWEKVPDVNLFNREGLPACPFRTDAN